MSVPRFAGPLGSATPILLFSLAAILSCSRASAQEQPAEPLALNPVTVTATRVPTPESEVGSSVTVITSEEMQRKQERTLPEALADVPGLNVVQTGGPGGTTSVFIRGANSDQTKVLIDGIDATDPATGTFNFEHVLTWDLDRVEIVRGPQSGLYGSDAIGGVINIITKKGAGPAQFTSSVEGGSFTTANQNAAASGSISRFNYYVDFAHALTLDTPVTPSDLVPVGRSVPSGDSYDNKTVSARLGADLTDNFDVGVVTRYVNTTLNFTGDDFLGPESLKSTEDDEQLFTRGTAHLVSFGGVLDQTLGLAYTKFDQSDLDPNVPDAVPSLFNGDQVKVDWQGNIKIAEGQLLILRAEHQLQLLSEPVGAEITDNAGIIQLNSHFGERLFNTVSLRYDSYDPFGGKPTFRIAPTLLFPETGTKLNASVGSGFKTPTLADLFENFPSFGFFGNPNLKPETSVGYDAGFEQTVFNKRVQFGATYFHNNITNLININETGTSFKNIGKATTYGVENFVAYTPWDSLTLRGDYTYLIANDDILQTELLRRPKHKASLNTAWHVTDKAVLSTTLLYVGPWVDVNRAGTVSGLNANGYTIVNVEASYDLKDGLTAYGRIDNLLDRHYQDPIGFQRPGFGIFAGVRIAFNATGTGVASARKENE
jgi:vitamin B12 transporter